MRWLVFLILVAGLVVVGLRYLPPDWDPRTPLDLTGPPNFVTGLKLRWLTLHPQACFAAFATSDLLLVRIPDRSSEVGCEIENAVRLASTVRTVPAAPIVTCPLAAAWVLFERNTLQPEVRLHLGSDVVTVRHFGSYACRNVNHALAGPRSQHATANAIDIAGFVLRDGREIRVVQAWSGTGPEAAFLHAVHDGACKWFNAVLGLTTTRCTRITFTSTWGAGASAAETRLYATSPDMAPLVARLAEVDVAERPTIPLQATATRAPAGWRGRWRSRRGPSRSALAACSKQHRPLSVISTSRRHAAHLPD